MERLPIQSVSKLQGLQQAGFWYSEYWQLRVGLEEHWVDNADSRVRELFDIAY